MAKVKKNKTVKKVSEQQSALVNVFDSRNAYIAYFIISLILVIFLYKPLILEGLETSGSDIVSGIGKTHQLKMWEEKTGHYPLWNPYMFGGMPTYHRFGPRSWFVDTLLNQLDFLGDWRMWHFLLGALGIFLLVKFLGLNGIAAFIAGIAFILMPHFQALIVVGHFAKFRALMWMPFVILTVLYFLQKRNLLSALLLTLAIAMQFRTQHYQILFYTLIIAIALTIPTIIQLIKKKFTGEIGKLTGLGLLAVILTFLIVSQNFFSIKEYTPYSTRGGDAISIQKKESAQDKKGVGFDYATNWSYSVSELWNLAIPKFHGGTSNEKYTGDAVPAWKNRVLPTYWGDMPFTQSYEYLGIVILFMALLGIIFCWADPVVKGLTFYTLFAILMSLGKHFAVLYRVFFYYMPYFDKFRVPMMILTSVMFTISVLAAYGISFVLSNELTKKEIQKRLYIAAGAAAFLLMIPLLLGSTFALSTAAEVGRYGREVVTNLKKVRLDMLTTSSLITLIYFAITAISVFTVLKKWMPKNFFPAVLATIVIIDFLLINVKYLDGRFSDIKQAEMRQYKKTTVDQAILKDRSIYRVFPVGQLFQDTRWSYYYQTIGGYSPAKTQVIQEIIENNLYGAKYDTYGINWNLLNTLNVKYLVAGQQLPAAQLKPVAQDAKSKLFAYENLNVLPRAYFVGESREIKNGVERLTFINSKKFSPEKLAVIEKPLSGKIESPDSAFAQITNYEPEKIEISTYTDKDALLVLSEIYYPAGWTATLDGKTDLEIYKTNHLIRSVLVPAGNHNIVFSFKPKSYYLGLTISSICLYLTVLLVAVLLFLAYRKKETAAA